jgi:hypothetical protein
MSLHPETPDSVRRVVLPSGKTIEIVYYPESTAPVHRPSALEEVHVCRACSSKLVYPVAWDEAEHGSWSLVLRCPNCEWHGEGVYDHATVERLDQELDRGAQALMRDLRQLAHANMEDEADRFAQALEADQVWPMDF